MKKFLVALVGLIVTTHAVSGNEFGKKTYRNVKILERPSKQQIQKWEQEFEENTSKCPLDKPLYNEGKCVTCDYIGTLSINPWISQYCSKVCPNRKIVTDGIAVENGGHYYCVLKDTPGPEYYFDAGTLSWLKDCPDDKPLYIDGECYSCYKKLIDVTLVRGCEKCPNKNIINGKCYMPCPDDMFLANGHCFACDDTRALPTGIKKDECDKCSNRIQIGQYCYNSECPDDKPVLFEFLGCRACDESNLNVTELSGREKCDSQPIKQ